MDDNLLESHKPIMTFRSFVKDIDKVDKRTKWRDSINKLMSDHGFQIGGSGNYGSVFIHRNLPYIVKIFMKDTAYLHWLSFCFANQHNPYVPKIRGKVAKLTGTFFAIRMERLTQNEYAAKTFSAKLDRLLDLGPTGDVDLDSIVDVMKRHRPLLDIGDWNIMLRGKQPVLIDPFYNWIVADKFTDNPKYTIDPEDISNFDQLF